MRPIQFVKCSVPAAVILHVGFSDQAGEILEHGDIPCSSPSVCQTNTSLKNLNRSLIYLLIVANGENVGGEYMNMRTINYRPWSLL
jgi:hypothetical protein